MPLPSRAGSTSGSAVRGRVKVTGPAIGAVELESIARGMVTADVVLKKAAVRLVFSEPTTPGKYLLLFSGPVADVEESFKGAIDFAQAAVIDQLLLPYAHETLVEGLEGLFSADWGE